MPNVNKLIEPLKQNGYIKKLWLFLRCIARFGLINGSKIYYQNERSPQQAAGKCPLLIIFLLQNPELRNQMSENALERFQSTFELTKVVKQQANWIEELLI